MLLTNKYSSLSQADIIDLIIEAREKKLFGLKHNIHGLDLMLFLETIRIYVGQALLKGGFKLVKRTCDLLNHYWIVTQ